MTNPEEPKTNHADELYTHMQQINPLEQLERASGTPRPIPDPTVSQSPTEEIRTVVYFMPDGDAIIRYVKPSDAKTSHHNFVASQAFLVLAVIPSINGGAPSVQFLKSRIDLKGFMTAAVKAYMATPENEIETAQEVLGLSREHVETLIDRANAPEKLKLQKISPEVDRQLEETRWATIELKGETEEPPNYRLGCEEEDGRPIHPDCAENGHCGCGRD